MRGWRLAGIRRSPGPLIGTVAASAVAATMAVAATSIAGAHTTAPAGRLAGASVVVAARTTLHVTVAGGDKESIPLSAYRGVPARLARELARVPGVARAAGETGFPGGVVRPGDVDLVAVTARPGVSAGQLAHRIRAVLPAAGYTVATGAARGDLANLSAPAERANGQSLGGALIPPIVLVSLFVLASTTALAVNLRRRRFALLRTIGASRGQVRRAILAELTVCGLVGGLLGLVPGAALGALGVRALAAHQMLPAGSGAWLTPWLLLVGVRQQRAGGRAEWPGRRPPGQPDAPGPGAAGNRGRTPVAAPGPGPARPGRGRWRRHPGRYTLGAKSPAGQLALALPLLLACMVAVALLGPLLVALAAWLARPLLAVGGPSARLALAAITAQPRRAAVRGDPGGHGRVPGRLRLLRQHLDRARHHPPGGANGDRGSRTVGTAAQPGHAGSGGVPARGPGRGRCGPGRRDRCGPRPVPALRRGRGGRPDRSGHGSGRDLGPPDHAAPRADRGQRAGSRLGRDERARRVTGHGLAGRRYPVPGHGQRGVLPVAGRR